MKTIFALGLAIAFAASAFATPHKVDPKQAVQQGVQQGINKLKGLFGK